MEMTEAGKEKVRTYAKRRVEEGHAPERQFTTCLSHDCSRVQSILSNTCTIHVIINF